MPLDATTTSAGTTYFNTNPTLSSANYSYANTLSGTGQTVGNTGQGFFDDYVFTIGASTADSVTSTINLGNSQISNLQASLFFLQRWRAAVVRQQSASGHRRI